MYELDCLGDMCPIPIMKLKQCKQIKEKGGQLKAEFYLPFVVNAMVAAGEADVKVLPTSDKWYGMTYAEDKQKVIDAIAGMIKQGIYPERLWKA